MAVRSIEKYGEKAFLGDVAGDIRVIESTANLINKELNPMDDPAKRVVNGNLGRIIGDMAKAGEWRCESARGLIEASRDRQRPANKGLAEERLGFLVPAVYMAVKYGENEGLTRALESGSAESLERMLPLALQGLGEKLVELEIANPEIRGILEKLDKKGRVLKRAGEGGKEGLRKNLEGAIGELSELDLDRKGDEEMMRVSAYLGWEVGMLGVAGQKGVLQEGEEYSANDGLSELAGLFSGEAYSRIEFQNFVEAVMGGSHYTANLEHMPIWFSRPDYVLGENNGFEGEAGLIRWQRLLWTTNAAANWLSFKNTGDYRGELSSLLSFPELKSISCSEVSKLFNEEEGFRKASRIIYKKLFTRDMSFPDREVFAIRMKFKREEPRIEAWSNDFPKFLEEVVVPQLVEEGIEVNVARIYASCAARLFVDVTTSDKTDSARKNNGIALDPIRSKIDPEEKALQKAGILTDADTGVARSGPTEGDQQFGGEIGVLIRHLADLEGETFVNRMRANAERGVYSYLPKNTALSWAEMASVTISRVDARTDRTVRVKEMSVAQMLMEEDDIEGTKVSFGKDGKDWLFGSYGRDIAPAVDFFGDLFKGKIEIDFKKLGEFTKELSNQRTEVLKICVPGTGHKMMEGIMGNPKFLAMCIVAGFGGRLPIHEDIVLPIPEENYDRLVNAILDGISGINDEYREEVRRILHADKPTVGSVVFKEFNKMKRERTRIRFESGRNADRARKRGII